jgi:hypothetical protein
MVKNAVLFGILFASQLGLSSSRAQDGPQILDEIVAKINDEIVTLTDLNSALNERRLELRQETGDSAEAEKRFEAEERFLLKSYVHARLLLQKAEELGFDADIDADVAAFMENMRKDMGIPSLDVLDQYLRQQGSSMQKFRAKVKENMMTRSLIQSVVYSKITLLTPEVEKFYNENLDSFTEPAKVELAEILFLTEGKDRDAVRARAEEVLERLNQDEPFEELAKEYSEGPTASKGGEIGSFNKGTMNAALEEAAFGIDVDTHSEIVESDYGFQIIKVLSRVDAIVKPLEEVRPQIADTLYQKKAQPGMEEFVKELIRDSYIFIAPKYAEKYDIEGLI